MENKNSNFKVDVSPEMQLYKILQRQSYDIGTALAEFVDNSVQSFIDTRRAVPSIKGSEPTLKVSIEISSTEKRITIEDNAGGINRGNFQRAIRMGHGGKHSPEPESLSVYGIGMKSSAIWFSNQWKIETSAVGSGEKLTTTFDLEQLLASGNKSIEVESSPEDYNKHYTKITINDCLRDLADRDNQFRDSVLPYLLETFYKFENVFIEIKHDDLVLRTTQATLDEPTPLVYPRVDKKGDALSSTPFRWKKKLDFTHAGKSVRGFIMIRETGSYPGPGIRLLRNRRVINGTEGGGRQNKPEVLLGTSNKYASQRIYGEVHLNDFPVNFMKTGFDINMDSLYRAIKTQISARPPDVIEDFIEQATCFRKKKATSDPRTKPGTEPEPETEAKTEAKPKRTRKGETNIPFSQELNDALQELKFKKLYRLYESLCHVSLIKDPVLAYVGAWALLDSLAAQMGKTDGKSFDSFYNSEISRLATGRGERNDYRHVIYDLHKKGNMNKHSPRYEAMEAQQLASDFPTIEKFLIHCAETVVKST